MQTIGERFEEARKRKGISLREASEATKIRSDFLENIEQNRFDFELPEIYKRGFVKNYANYLKLDLVSTLTDYDTQVLSNSNKMQRADGSELFGSMDVRSNSEATDKPSLGKISKTSKSDEIKEEKSYTAEMDKTFYLKAGLVVLGVLAVLIVIVGLIAAVLNSGDETATDVSNSTVTSSTPETASDTTATSGQETVSLIASGNVYVLVKQRNDNKELVRKTLSEGDKLDFSKEGPIDILFTAGENLVIVNPAGERLRPKGEGTAKISIP